MTPEAASKNLVRKVLKQINAVWVMPTTRGFGASGASDFIVNVGGRYVEIETKARGCTASPLQRVHINKMAKAGGTCLVVSTDALRLVRASDTYDDPGTLIEGVTKTNIEVTLKHLLLTT